MKHSSGLYITNLSTKEKKKGVETYETPFIHRRLITEDNDDDLNRVLTAPIVLVILGLSRLIITFISKLL
jgi:hypothetical protein